ncbi:MAG TPA: aspartate--tRNA ligase [Clostridia bacterium]|nr:aspartate--tRNA ligase [Clostridia bacterium]
MEENIANFKRTKMCGEFTSNDSGKEVVVMGFVAKYRNLGKILFIDLRDRTGVLQLAFYSDSHIEAFEKALKIRNEYVILAKGVVTNRTEKNINKNMPTGDIEVVVNELKILSEADTPPFNIGDVSANETLRLKYRYLDLRRESLQKNLFLRHKVTLTTHKYMDKMGFINIETPFLGKSTPEGARDYLVPSRVNKGTYYALPQSPQIYKQLLMISGLDRYYQVAKCFRDEDLRANRQPEFTQIDLEMSYVDNVEDILQITEGLVKEIFKETIGMEFPDKFRRIRYQEAMERFGSDKPDTRFGIELKDLTQILNQVDFTAFQQAKQDNYSIRAINVKGQANITRKEIDKYSDIAREYGAKGVFTIAYKDDNEISSSLLKYLDTTIISAITEITCAKEGDLIVIVSDKNKVVFDALGACRLYAGKKLGLVDEKSFDILWVTEFPLYEYDENENRLVAMHHPFTSPMNEDIEFLDTNPLAVRAKAYDLVINGQEAGGGSIRIHSRELQKKMFDLIGLTEKDIVDRFGFFIEAFSYGVPPHGGLALGLDRLIMLLSGTDNIKETIAFPKNQSAQCLMSSAPSFVDQKQLDELFDKNNNSK